MPVEKLIEEPYASILCYPCAARQEAVDRAEELKKLGVEAVEFTGPCSASNIPVLGKGFAGIVVIAFTGKKRLALKMRRLDGGRENLFHEAEMLQKANRVGVGPKFEAASENFLLSEFIDGGILEKWLEKNKEPAAFRGVIRDVLEQCRRLDEAGIDHGELSAAPKHILTDKTGKPYIVDFETAGIRKTANVTAVCQHLFFGNGEVAVLTREVLGEKDKNQFVRILRDYKKEPSKTRFEAVLQKCLL